MGQADVLGLFGDEWRGYVCGNTAKCNMPLLSMISSNSGLNASYNDEF